VISCHVLGECQIDPLAPFIRRARTVTVATMQSLCVLRLLAQLSLLVTASACGGGGGGSRPPANPAPRPTATGVADLDGYWVCVSNELVSTNTVDVTPTEPGEVVLILNGELVGNVTYQQSLYRADLELELGFPLGWYTNTSSGPYLDFQVGYDRLRQGAGEFYDYVNYGVRLAAAGPDTLVGFESSIDQLDAQSPRTQWTYTFQLERTTEPRTAAKAYESRMGEPFQPKGGKWFHRREKKIDVPLTESTSDERR